MPQLDLRCRIYGFRYDTVPLGWEARDRRSPGAQTPVRKGTLEKPLGHPLRSRDPPSPKDNIENELFNLKYVVLRRQNMLRVIASTAAAHQRGQWFVENSSTPDSEIKRPITIDTNAIPMNRSFFPLMHLLDEAERDFDILDGLMEYRPSLFLTYEDDVRADPTNAYARICDHIGITPMPAQIKRRRTNPEPLSNMIANYNEVSALLRGTSYEWMLTED